MPVSQLLATFLKSKVKFSTVFHNVLLLWSEPPSLYRNPFLVCCGEPVFCLLYTFRAWINKLLRSPSPLPFMFHCLNVVNFLLSPAEPLVICGYETVHFEKENHAVLRIRDVYPGSEFFPSGSRFKQISNPGSGSASKNWSTFNPKNCF
jgi:hypothetical protein